MIYKDKWGFPVDRTIDGGDSCVRMGLLALASVENLELEIYKRVYYFKYGPNGEVAGLRHPKQEPWNNPKNFSRDQLVRLVAALNCSPKILLLHANQGLFKAALKRFGFAQNVERDAPGSTKYPWPHKVDGKWRLFDMPDPLTPDVLYMMAKAAEHPLQYVFMIPGVSFFLLSLLIERAFNIKNEQDRTICMCSVFGRWAYKAYVKIIGMKKIEKDLLQYWKYDRDEEEYATAMLEVLNEFR